MHVHVADHSQIEIGRNGAENHGQNHGQGIASGKGGFEQIELADEATGGWNAGQGKHEHQHQDGSHRIAARQPLAVVQGLVGVIGCGQQHEDSKGSHVHEQVDDEIGHGGGHALRCPRQEAKQGITGMGDGRIGQHPLETVLAEGGDVTHGHGQQGNHRQYRGRPAAAGQKTRPGRRWQTPLPWDQRT